MDVIVVAHHSRYQMALELTDQLGGQIVLDEGDHGARWTHREALWRASLASGPTLILEDDAVPCAGMLERADSWAARFPGRLVSLYLGTGRPPQYQRQIGRMMDSADAAGLDYIELPQLIHGVGYVVWPEWSKAVADTLPGGPADFAIGDAARRQGVGNIIYPTTSLVDHLDGPSVEVHPDGQPRIEVRKAWRFADA